MLAKIEPFWSWHTPIAWTGYIALADGLIWRIRGESPIRNDAPSSRSCRRPQVSRLRRRVLRDVQLRAPRVVAWSLAADRTIIRRLWDRRPSSAKSS
jgi:hypothetical protein